MADRQERVTASGATSGVTVGYEAPLWQMADARLGSMDATECKHFVLGLIFLKYISDAFEEQHARLGAEQATDADPEALDQYRAQCIFRVPPESRWAYLKAQALQKTIGQIVEDAMAGIERDNPALKGVLPQHYARPALDKQRFGQLIDRIRSIKVGDVARRAEEVVGRVYDPYCVTSGMLVQSAEFIRQKSKRNGRGADRHAKGDFIRSKPPCNMSKRRGEHLRYEARWQHGVPPAGNANVASAYSCD